MKVLKISSVFKKLKYSKTTTKPKIILSGDYLSANGFRTGEKIDVVMEPGLIIIRSIK